MHERTERLVTALLDDIERGVKLARLHGSEPREAQQVESFPQHRGVIPVLRPTRFDCIVEVPITRPERAEGVKAFETIRLWGELAPSGALLIQGIQVESRQNS